MSEHRNPIPIKAVCAEVQSGALTFDEGVDRLMAADAGSTRPRIDYSDFLWRCLGRPPPEVHPTAAKAEKP